MSKFFLCPGHGGRDPGAIGIKGTHEADINLTICKIIGRILTEQKQSIVYSRTTDTTLSLTQRTDIANKNKCDVFISIHCNAAVNKNAHGTETFSFPHSSEGEKLSEFVQNELIKATGLADRGTKEAFFGVLRMSSMPAILVETAFISNSVEENLLLSADFQEKTALAIVKGLFKYLKIDFVEKKVVKPIDKNTNVSNIMYRVVTGSFQNRNNAEDRITELKKVGFESFIVIK